MKNYTCATCGEGVLLEPREVEESGPYCMEHLFSEEFPALKILTDQVITEEQRGPNRQEENRAATTETHQQEGSVMEDSIAKLYEPEVSNALTTLLLEGTGAPEIRLPLIAWELGNRNVGPEQRVTSLLRFEVYTSSGYLTWVEEDLPALATIMYTTPDKLLDAALHVAEHPGDEGALRDARNVIWSPEEAA